MTEQEYRAAPGISQSELKHILVSPAHYRWAKQNPLVQSQAVMMGTYLHALVLEGRMPEHIRPEGISFSTTDGKQWLAVRGCKTLTEYEHKNGAMIDNSCVARLLQMRDSLIAHPFVGPVLQDPATEKEVSKRLAITRHDFVGHKESTWNLGPSDSGVLNTIVKGRADLIFTSATGQRIGADIKKVAAGKANPRSFLQMACDEDRELAFQAAYYTDIFNLDGFMFFVIEDEPFELSPDGQSAVHRVEVFQVEPATIEFGRKQYQRALATLAECERTNEWPGRPREVQRLQYPDWKMETIK